MLGFLPGELRLAAIKPVGEGLYLAHGTEEKQKTCENYNRYDVCNWLLPASDDSPYCLSCRLTEIIPNLDHENSLRLWYRVEIAKRRLLYSLLRARLPVKSRYEFPASGLSFRFLSDNPSSSGEFNDEIAPGDRIITGHNEGVITINIAEADPGAMENMRESMNERYRTLLGHFRHESGHYYWELLVKESPFLEECRALFGDERIDYRESLDRYYRYGPGQNWEQRWVSAYAAAHPWEDFAETWAHYLHMTDTLETAHDFGMSLRDQHNAVFDYRNGHFADISTPDLLIDWIGLTAALNAMNRSMGLADAYPFVISETTTRKLDLIRRIITYVTT